MPCAGNYVYTNKKLWLQHARECYPRGKLIESGKIADWVDGLATVARFATKRKFSLKGSGTICGGCYANGVYTRDQLTKLGRKRYASPKAKRKVARMARPDVGVLRAPAQCRS